MLNILERLNIQMFGPFYVGLFGAGVSMVESKLLSVSLC